MDVEIEHTDDGTYTALIREDIGEAPSWMTPEPLTREQLLSELRRRNVDIRHALSALDAADTYFSKGLREKIRKFRGIADKIAQGIASSDELQLVLSELVDEISLLPTSFLVGIVSLMAPDARSTQALADVLRLTRDPIAAESVLLVLRDSAPEIFLSVARPFINGIAWDVGGRVQGWSMTYAIPLLARGQSREVLDDIAKVALDDTVRPGVRRDARRAIVRLSKASNVDDNVLALSDVAVLDLIGRAQQNVSHAADEGSTGVL